MDRFRRLLLGVLMSFGFFWAQAIEAETDLPGWFREGARLTGHGVQADGKGWTIRIEVTGRRAARIAYKSIPCGGELRLTDVKRDQLIFVETISRNRANCITGGTVILEQIGSSSVSFRWAGGGITAEGTLAILDDIVS